MSQFLVSFLLLSISLHACLVKGHVPTVDPSLWPLLESEGSATIILSMTEGSVSPEILQKISQTRFKSREQRLKTVSAILKAHATKSQENLLNFINHELKQTKNDQIRVQQLWITNQVIVKNCDVALTQKLAMRDDISVIEKDRHFPQNFRQNDPVVKTQNSESSSLAETEDNQKFYENWHMYQIGANFVWGNGTNGTGIVVSSIDSGVHVTHESLRDNHRLEYGWFDPEFLTTTPNDIDGHGTHTMGILAGHIWYISPPYGGAYLGAAPGSQWISCRGCFNGSCSLSSLLGCGQWILCPTTHDGQNEDCTMAPHIVSNSWSNANVADEFYDGVILAWRAAGIIPIFSVGNSGPNCGTLEYPGGINPDVIGVGSTDTNVGDGVSYFSSVGPPPASSLIKPDVVAPGQEIFSAWISADDGYRSLSGTSMSCPLVAGLTALILSHDNTLTFQQVKNRLTIGAVHPYPFTSESCGGVNQTIFPNYHAGYGRVDAVSSVFGLATLDK